MALKIFTYSNPYNIEQEPYWREIESYPHFCVSQTMVNGLEEILKPHGNKTILTTIRILVNSLYNDWEDKDTRVSQMIEVDNAICNLSMDESNVDTIKHSLEYNTKSLVSSIRLFVELGVSPDDLRVDDLNNDQKLLVEIYNDICNRKRSTFRFDQELSKDDITEGVYKALLVKHKDLNDNSYSKDAIVIHGVHQFSAAMLCAIENISKYIDVIFLFNYQKQYQAIYQTWLNIYSLFDTEISMSNVKEFRPSSLMKRSYASNTLADCMGNLANGKFVYPENAFDKLKIIEFANLTEFAGYCTVLFEKALEEKNSRSNDKTPTLKYMSEQMYSTSGKVNDILRAYFPEQFWERHFLDYPIGHFFVSAVNMWNNDTSMVVINDLSDVKECLGAGILKEKRSGNLLNTINLVEPFISKENTLSGMIRKLNELHKISIRKNNELSRVAYVNVDKDDLKELKAALDDLSKIIKSFFNDFNKGADNFQRFYNRVHDFITNRIQNQDDFDEETKTVIKCLLNRLENTNLPETGSFTCLKQTLSYYLSQDENAGKSASWIVRDFEQIDGDILRSKDQQKKDVCYHFCCLSDKDMSAVNDERLPWPLDIHFFEVAYAPLDLKYQIFLKSKMEFKNFKRYALLYGLQFNRVGCKLSYIKTDNRKENEFYHLLSMFGIEITKYQSQVESRYISKVELQTDDDNAHSFGLNDVIRYRMCPYKFAMESCIQGKTMYRNRFLVIWYMRILLQNAILKRIKNDGITSIDKLQSIVQEEYMSLDDNFTIANELEKTQIISGVYLYAADIIKKYRQETIKLDKSSLQDDFLVIKTDEYQTGASIDLNNIIRNNVHYNLTYNKGCLYCASKDICLHARSE